MAYTLVASRYSGSFAAQVLMHELAADVDIRWVERASEELFAVNPLGQVPVLVFEDGQTLVENTAIFITLAEAHPESDLLPRHFPLRSEVLRWFAYCNATLHPAFIPAFIPDRFHPIAKEHGAVKKAALTRLRFLFQAAERQLKNRTWLCGDQYTMADIYLGMFGEWLSELDVDVFTEFPNYAAMLTRYEERPSVIAARTEELKSGTNL